MEKQTCHMCFSVVVVLLLDTKRTRLIETAMCLRRGRLSDTLTCVVRPLTAAPTSLMLSDHSSLFVMNSLER